MLSACGGAALPRRIFIACALLTRPCFSARVNFAFVSKKLPPNVVASRSSERSSNLFAAPNDRSPWLSSEAGQTRTHERRAGRRRGRPARDAVRRGQSAAGGRG